MSDNSNNNNDNISSNKSVEKVISSDTIEVLSKLDSNREINLNNIQNIYTVLTPNSKSSISNNLSNLNNSGNINIEEFKLNDFLPKHYMTDHLLLPSFYKPENMELAETTRNSIRSLLYITTMQKIKQSEFRYLKEKDDSFKVKEIVCNCTENSVLVKLRNYFYLITFRSHVKLIDSQLWYVDRGRLQVKSKLRTQIELKKAGKINDLNNNDDMVRRDNCSTNTYKVLVYHDTKMERFYTKVTSKTSLKDKLFLMYYQYKYGY